MKNTFIKISNNGVIDEKSLTLFGASTKRGDNSKIGFFGSGLKYAIAVLLREKIDFKIFSGLEEIKISTVKEKFRDEEFDVIEVNDKKTNFTTQMGPEWLPWFSIREIYCNALDEVGAKIGVANKAKGELGKTNIYVTFDEKISEIFNNWGNYFSEKREDLIQDIAATKNDYMVKGYTKLFIGSEDFIVYRKGVQCYFKKGIKSLYHYDLSWIEINESRVIKNTFDIDYHMPKALENASVEVAKNILENYEGCAEEDFRWDNCDFSENWLTALEGRKLVRKDIAGYFIDEITRGNCIILPNKMVDGLKSVFGDRVNIVGIDQKGYVEVKMTEEMKEKIEVSLAFFEKINVKIKNRIGVCKFEDDNVLGRAIRTKSEIMLSAEYVENAERDDLLAVMYEEYAHLSSSFDDKTREFQDYIIKDLIKAYQKIIDIKI
jgi:hypothetical protein